MIANRTHMLCIGCNQKRLDKLPKHPTKQARDADNDEWFYHWAWMQKPHICEECGLKLWQYSRWFISHILVKKTYGIFRHDLRNVNILCRKHHKQWETGDRLSMNIYPSNRLIMNALMIEANGRETPIDETGHETDFADGQEAAAMRLHVQSEVHGQSVVATGSADGSEQTADTDEQTLRHRASPDGEPQTTDASDI